MHGRACPGDTDAEACPGAGSTYTTAMDTARRERLSGIVSDLKRIFGDRLEAVVAYGRRTELPVPTFALVTSMTMDDLVSMAVAAPTWHLAGAATPLVLPRAEFAQALDVFPIEYGEIIESHDVLLGEDPFAGIAVDPRDVRRAVEVQATSHLLHLRENFIQHAGRPAAIDMLVRDSAPGFEVLLRRMARLDGAPSDSPASLGTWASERAGLDPRVVGDLLALASDDTAPVDGIKLFPAYLVTMDELVRVIDQWKTA